MFKEKIDEIIKTLKYYFLEWKYYWILWLISLAILFEKIYFSVTFSLFDIGISFFIGQQ